MEMSYTPINWCIARYGCRELTVGRIRPLPVLASSVGITGLEYRGIASTDSIVQSLLITHQNKYCT